MKAVILLNGEKPNFELSQALEGRKIICADGAYNWAEPMGIRPDVLLGDFDSIVGEGEAPIIQKFRCDKNQTDGQLCLDYAIAHDFTDILILGGGGGRDDHYFANVALLIRGLLQNVSVRMLTNSCEMCVCSHFFSRVLPKNTLFSLTPLTPIAHILSTEGLEYPLHNATLHFEETLGISNVALGGLVNVEISAGLVLVFVVYPNINNI